MAQSSRTNVSKFHNVTVPQTAALTRDQSFVLDVDRDPTTMAEIRERVEETTLPEDLQALVDCYEDALGVRNGFLWQWLYRVFDAVTLSCVPDEDVSTVCEIKTIMAMYNVLLDDLAEKHDDTETFWELSNAVVPGRETDWDRPDIDRKYARVGEEVWTVIEEKLRNAPRHDEFRTPFEFDMRQAINAMDYSWLELAHPELANLTETWEYDSHNIMLYALVDVDLMYAPNFDTADLGVLREIVYTFQQLWRIGNWVVTWEREIAEHDYGAAIIVAALKEGVITPDLLEQLEAGEVTPEAVTGPINQTDIEEAFLADWQRRRDHLRERTFDVNSFDVDALIDGIESLLQHHLASRGHR